MQVLLLQTLTTRQGSLKHGRTGIFGGIEDQSKLFKIQARRVVSNQFRLCKSGFIEVGTETDTYLSSGVFSLLSSQVLARRKICEICMSFLGEGGIYITCNFPSFRTADKPSMEVVFIMTLTHATTHTANRIWRCIIIVLNCP